MGPGFQPRQSELQASLTSTLCPTPLGSVQRRFSRNSLHQQCRLPAGNLSAFSVTWEMALRQRDSQGRAFHQGTPVLPRMQYPQKPGTHSGKTYPHLHRSQHFGVEETRSHMAMFPFISPAALFPPTLLLYTCIIPLLL